MIWLIGNKGMLGSEVEPLLGESGRECVVSDKEVDITDYNQLRDFAGEKTISWIVNCSAYTAVDRAEDEPEAARAVNSRGVQNIARLASEKKARLIHISTDYVFDGTKDGAYTEEDSPNPRGVYGSSKLEGEKSIQGALEEYFILRTAWLYGENGPNFVNTMLHLFGGRNEVRVVDDQWGSPTFAIDLAGAIVRIIEKRADRYGIFHFTNEGRTNWYEFAKEIHQLARERGIVQKEVNIVPIPTEQYPTRAVRPRNSLLSKEKIKRELGVECREWKIALEEYIKNF